MRTLYLDCGMGAAGDMLTAALMELLPDQDTFLKELNELSIPGVMVTKEKAVKCGITGTHISVKIDGIEEEPGGDGTEHSHGHHHAHDHHHDEHHDHHAHDHYHDHDHHHDEHHDHHHDHDHYHDEHHDHHHDHDEHHDHHHDNEHHHHHDHYHDAEQPVHFHRGMQEIEQLISGLALSHKVQEDVLAVYRLIAEAESHVHGVPVTEIHFHEVGMMDAIADVTAVCMLMEKLSPDEVVVSPVHVGSGQVKCAHGTLPIPAPATAYLLQNVPIYSGNIRGELCTPTGAALLRHFATRFDKMPVMKLSAIGYGMGKKDFEAANCVRAMLGESEDKTDAVLELSCNVDDMTAEAISYAMERLLEKGAMEVYTVAIGMKKSRPGTLLRVMCQEQKKEEMLSLLFSHTTTLGVRETVTHRYVLKREINTLDTPYGPVRRKDSSGYGVSRSKYEYEDLARIAREQQISLEEAKRLIEQSIG